MFCFSLRKRWSFSLSTSSVNVTKSAADLVTFTEEMLNEKLHFLRSVCSTNLSLLDKLQPIMAQFHPGIFASWKKKEKAGNN